MKLLLFEQCGNNVFKLFYHLRYALLHLSSWLPRLTSLAFMALPAGSLLTSHHQVGGTVARSRRISASLRLASAGDSKQSGTRKSQTMLESSCEVRDTLCA